jgi:hypothetical protein
MRGVGEHRTTQCPLFPNVGCIYFFMCVRDLLLRKCKSTIDIAVQLSNCSKVLRRYGTTMVCIVNDYLLLHI